MAPPNWKKVGKEALRFTAEVAVIYGCIKVFSDHVAFGTILIGPSMMPTVQPHGELGLVDKYSYKYGNKTYEVGDVVIANISNKRVCKRVRAVAGETVQLRRGHSLVVPEGCVWLLGDNPTNSYDSRNYGPVELEKLEGRVAYKLARNNYLMPIALGKEFTEFTEDIPTLIKDYEEEREELLRKRTAVDSNLLEQDKDNNSRDAFARLIVIEQEMAKLRDITSAKEETRSDRPSTPESTTPESAPTSSGCKDSANCPGGASCPGGTSCEGPHHTPHFEMRDQFTDVLAPSPVRREYGVRSMVVARSNTTHTSPQEGFARSAEEELREVLREKRNPSSFSFASYSVSSLFRK